MASCTACGVSAAIAGYKFTGKERDSESNLDMIGARYYGATIWAL